MKLILAALTMWSLPFFGASCGSANVQTAQPAPQAESTPFPSGKTITLSKEHPVGSFALQADVIEKAPPVLEVSLLKVSNPAAKPVNVFVYILPANEELDAATDRITVGNFSLYPADRPGKFMLDAASAFRKLSDKKTTAKEWRLLFVLQKEAQEGSAQIEVTIAPPSWKSEKG